MDATLQLAEQALGIARVLHEVAATRRRVFKTHSLSQRMQYRCPGDWWRDPNQPEEIMRPKCIPARKASGSSGKLICIRRKAHVRAMTGKGRRSARIGDRWDALREPIQQRNRALGAPTGEGRTMGALLALLEVARPKLSNAPLTDREERDASRAETWVMDLWCDDGKVPAEIADLYPLDGKQHKRSNADWRRILQFFYATAPGNFEG